MRSYIWEVFGLKTCIFPLFLLKMKHIQQCKRSFTSVKNMTRFQLKVWGMLRALSEHHDLNLSCLSWCILLSSLSTLDTLDSFSGCWVLLEESPWVLFLSFPWLLTQNWMLKWLLLEESKPMYMFTLKGWMKSFVQFWSALLFSCFVYCQHLCCYLIWICYVAVTTLVFCFPIRKW